MSGPYTQIVPTTAMRKKAESLHGGSLAFLECYILASLQHHLSTVVLKSVSIQIFTMNWNVKVCIAGSKLTFFPDKNVSIIFIAF